MVKLFRTSGMATMAMLFTDNKVIFVEVWTVDDVVEKIVAATTPEASVVNAVEIVEATAEAKSVATF